VSEQGKGDPCPECKGEGSVAGSVKGAPNMEFECPTCKGVGYIAPGACPRCNNTRKIIIITQNGKGIGMEVDCPDCQGEASE